MKTENPFTSKQISGAFLESLVRFALLAILLILCARVFAPFLNMMIWAVVLAVALYPMHQGLAKRLGGKQGRSATLIVLVGLLLVGVPMFFLGESFVSHLNGLRTSFHQEELTISPPDAKVAEWPVIGERLYKTWTEASEGLPAYLQEHKEQIKTVTSRLFASAANTLKSVLLMMVSLIIAGVMMGYGKSGTKAIERIYSRVVGPEDGPRLQKLSIGTVRSVAVGVLGVAAIQALLFGVGFIIAGIPAAGLLALITLLLGIIQMPAMIVAIPIIIYLWTAGDASTAANVFFTVYFLVSGLVDNVLKPMLLGRGVEAPMPVILLGALGGMVSGGFLGLFTGAVLLALGYQIFMGWVNRGSDSTQADAEGALPSE